MCGFAEMLWRTNATAKGVAGRKFDKNVRLPETVLDIPGRIVYDYCIVN